jgi:threonine aldolase
MPPEPQQFASDNYAGICPEAWAAMDAANRGSVPAYGEDPWTKRAADAFRTLFETDAADVFFAFNGTAANALALASLCQSYHSVICSASAHVETDECGAPEFFSNGSKLLVVASADGKLDPTLIRSVATGRSDIHFPKPRVVTITQPTETGQLYSLAEIRAIAATWTERALPMPAPASAAAPPT